MLLHEDLFRELRHSENHEVVFTNRIKELYIKRERVSAYLTNRHNRRVRTSVSQSLLFE